MFRQTPLKTLTFAAILAGLAAYTLTGGTFAKELVIDIAVLAILAISLDLIAGYGGMISLGHGAVSGAGAYAFAAATVLLGASPVAGLLGAILLAAAFGAAIGAVTARTRGIYFIMATMAFGQMAYVLVFDSKVLGGDDGLPGLPRLDLSGAGIDLQSPASFALFCLALLALTYVLAAALLRSGFGRTLCGIRENEDRMRALGVTVWRFKAAAFGFSGVFAGLSGALAAQHTMFVSPELLTWTVSGEVLVVVILGGLGTLTGPVAGAVFLVFLKHVSSGLTSYWHLIIGLSLILAVVSGGRGIYGGLEKYIESRLAHRSKSPVRPREGAVAAEVQADA
jgi:branched-chain amino acid transport system permease protein